MELLTADERAMLDGLLDVQRAQVAALLDAVDDDEARRHLVPSLTTVLGLLAHAIFVEQVWFHVRVAGRTRAEVGVPETVDDSFRLHAVDTIATVRERYLAACAESRRIAAAHELDEQFDWRGRMVSLRFIYGHMIAELARHAGHGDILVEQLHAARPAHDAPKS